MSQGADPNDAEPGAWANRYVFQSEQSTILQTGGFAGVHWTYTVEGQFVLSVDPETASASFAHVDANAIDETEPLRTLDPNDAFNLMGLTGAVVDDTTIEFTGKAPNETTVRLRLTLEDDIAHLTGETIPPPNSADFFILNLDATATRKYAGGTGESNHPYQIATAEQMNQIGLHEEDWDKHFQLTADIDLSQFDGQEGRPAFNVIASDADMAEYGFQGSAFTGVFDGNGHTVANFCYSREDTLPQSGIRNVGLFGYVDDPNAVIMNVCLVDPNVDVPAGDSVGALVGWLREGAVRDCSIRGGTVSGERYVGGLAGQIGWHGAGLLCSSATVVNSDSSASVLGVRIVGGLGGCNLGGTVTDCRAEARVTGDWQVGGLVGCHKAGTVAQCSSAGSVVGDELVGGLLGGTGVSDCACISDSLTTDCYSRARVEGVSFVGGLAGGHVMGTLEDCYSTGEVLGEQYVGGFLGSRDLRNPGMIVACLWDIETSGHATSAGGEGRTTAQMTTASMFLEAGWDFVAETENGTDEIWWIQEGVDYPRLWWESADAEF